MTLASVLSSQMARIPVKSGGQPHRRAWLADVQALAVDAVDLYLVLLHRQDSAGQSQNSKDGLAKSGWLVYVVSTVSQSQHAGA